MTLGVVTVLVVVATLFKNKVSLAGMWSTEAHNHRSLDLIPFNNWIDPPIWYGPLTNLVGNIFLFVPLGFLLFLMSRRRSLLLTTLAGASISLCIELAQYVFAVGYTDIDDLLFNTLGAALGGICAARLSNGLRGALVASFLFGSLAILSAMIATSM